MKYGDHHGFLVITLIDTPRAYADLKSEELGQVSRQLLVYFKFILTKPVVMRMK